VRRFPIVTVDVFTPRALEGNPLAVITDARGLEDAEMQALARETNLSETTFVLPGDSAGVPRVRIFTVREELPFAGHPTLGTALVLRGIGQEEVTLELAVGRIPVRFSQRDGAAFGEMRQRDPEFGARHQAAAVAAGLGVPADALDPALPVQTVSTGTAFVIVPLRSRAALAAVRFDWARAEPWLHAAGAHLAYFVVREPGRLVARMPFYGGEDPATGSAAGCAAAWLALYGAAASDQETVIEQGDAIARPSRLYVRARCVEGSVTDVRVGGHGVIVMRGEINL